MNPNSYSDRPNAYSSDYSSGRLPEKKKKNIWTKILIVLVSILIVMTGVLSAALFSLNGSIQEIAKPYEEIVLKNEETELSSSILLAQFYDLLVSEVEQYGGLDDAQEASAGLLTQIFVKTMKDCTVKTIEFDADRIVIEVQGVGVPLSRLNASLIASSASSAAVSYLARHPLQAVSGIFSGTEGVKNIVYGEYISLLLEAIKDRIIDMPDEPVHYTLTLRTGEDGKWILEDASESPADGTTIHQTRV